MFANVDVSSLTLKPFTNDRTHLKQYHTNLANPTSGVLLSCIASNTFLSPLLLALNIFFAWVREGDELFAREEMASRFAAKASQDLRMVIKYVRSNKQK